LNALSVVISWTLAILTVVFVFGILAGLGIAVCADRVVSIITRKATWSYEAWAANVISAMLSGQTPMAKLRILQAVMERDVDANPPPVHRGDVVPIQRNDTRWN
jgi:hypothetical protein